MSRLVRPTLAAILVAAAVLRVWGLDHGLPFTMARPDEREALEHTVGFPSGDLNPRWFVYPNLFFWLVWGWLELALAAMRLWRDLPPYAEMLATDMPTLLLAGRWLSVLVGVATVWATWRLGARSAGAAVGLVAAAVVATNYLHVRDSHALKADVHLTLGVLLAVAAMAAWPRWSPTGGALRVGAWIGSATAIKYPGVLLLAMLPWADPVAATARRRLVPLPGRGTLVATAAAVVVFLALCPFILIDTERLETTFTFSVQAVYGTRVDPPRNASLAELVVWYVSTRTFWYHAAVSLRHGCGLAIALVAPVALVLGLRRTRPRLVRLAAGFSLVYYGVISLSQVTQARYLTAVVPLLALAIAHAVTAGAARLPVAPGLRVAAGVLATLGLVAEPALSSIAHDRLAARADTRALALDWMAAHLPPGAVVARLGSTFFPVADPEVPRGVRIAEVPLGATDLDRYGVTHVITHEHPLPFSRLIPGQMAALRPRLTELVAFDPFSKPPRAGYEELDAYYIPLWGFDGVERPGPVVRIYRWEPAS